MKHHTTLCLAALLSAGCPLDDDQNNDTSTSGETGGSDGDSTGPGDGDGEPTGDGDGDQSGDGDGDPSGDGDGDMECDTPFADQDPSPDVEPLPLRTDTTHPLPLGCELRYIQRIGATQTVLIFAGMGGQWRQAGEYLQTLDPALDYLPAVNVAVVEVVNPYGWGEGHAFLDPELFTPFTPDELGYSTWGWWSWEDGDLYDPATPGAYPILIETGDAIENIVGNVDVFLQLGKEAGHRTAKPCAGLYDCNGGVVMSFSGFGLAEQLAASMQAAIPVESWDAWDVDHPIGDGFVYDDPFEGSERGIGIAAHWARETWGADTIEVILPTNTPTSVCYELGEGEDPPLPYAPAPDLYRARTLGEGRATVAAALRELALLL